MEEDAVWEGVMLGESTMASEESITGCEICEVPSILRRELR